MTPPSPPPSLNLLFSQRAKQDATSQSFISFLLPFAHVHTPHSLSSWSALGGMGGATSNRDRASMQTLQFRSMSTIIAFTIIRPYLNENSPRCIRVKNNLTHQLDFLSGRTLHHILNPTKNESLPLSTPASHRVPSS